MDAELKPMGISLREDGTLDRSIHDGRFPLLPPGEQSVNGITVKSKDVVINESTGVWVRVYFPQFIEEAALIPVVLYFHGGGFVVGSAAASKDDSLCAAMAAKAKLIMVSVNYRLAPEHPLPAAFEDAFDALRWCQTGLDDAHGDVSKCFLMGESAGATILHHLALRASKEDLVPVRIRGMISCVPGLLGMKRTASEIKYGSVDLKCIAACSKLSLPEGSDLDHPYVSFHEAPGLRSIHLPPILIVVGDKDLLHDRQLEYAQTLKNAGKTVTLIEYKGYGHFISFPELEDPEKQSEAYVQLNKFLLMCLE